MADIFSEVEEELRRDKYNALLRRYGPWVVGVAFLFLLGVGVHQLVWQPMQEARIHESADLYERARALREAGQTEQASAVLEEIARANHSGYAVLALMQQAEIAEEQGDAPRAAALYGAAADLAGDEAISGLARIRGLYAVSDTASYSEILARAEPLAAPGSPYRSSARELIAVAALRAGDLARARQEYQYLSLAPETPAGVRARAGEGLAAVARAEGAAAQSAPQQVEPQPAEPQPSPAADAPDEAAAEPAPEDILPTETIPEEDAPS